MSAKSSTRSSNSAEAAQLSEDLTTGLASADSTAAERVQNLQWIQQARGSQLSRAAAALKAQYGADDPQVQAAEAEASAASDAAARVAMVYQQLTTADPQLAENGWALHGRVYDAQLQPAPGFTVFLVDEKKTYQQAYGFAYTDSTGYFLLNYAPDPASEKAQAAEAPALFIEIADKKAQPVYLSTTAFQPVVGTADYEAITLPEGEPPIGDPTPEIRNIAMPARKKKKA